MPRTLTLSIVAGIGALALTACSGSETLAPGGVTSPVTVGVVTDSPASEPTTSPDATPNASAPVPTALAGQLDPGNCAVEVTSDVDDDIVVQGGSTCVLAGVNVDGEVLVESGGTLVADGAVIEGDIQASGFTEVSVSGGEVDGHIQLANGGRATVVGVTVEGDIEAENNAGGLQISDNAVDGNLQCEGNDPAPTGGGNTTTGDKEGQCAGL